MGHPSSYAYYQRLDTVPMAMGLGRLLAVTVIDYDSFIPHPLLRKGWGTQTLSVLTRADHPSMTAHRTVPLGTVPWTAVAPPRAATARDE